MILRKKIADSEHHSSDRSIECKSYLIQDAAQHDGFFDKEKAGVHKRAGNEAFVAKNYSKAEAEYTEAIKYDASDEMLWCNRSGANLRLGKAEQAFNDAQKSRTLKGNYMKVDIFDLTIHSCEDRHSYQEHNNHQLSKGFVWPCIVFAKTTHYQAMH